MTKIQTVKINPVDSDSGKETHSLGFSDILSDAVSAEGAAKLTLAGASYTQCDATSSYV